MPAGDQLLLDVGAINEQLSHGASIAISIDATDANGSTDNQ